MNKLALVAAAALTAATFGAAAIAQDTVSSFNNADANKDGVVSWDEAFGVFPTLTQDIFNQADANADGNLDEAEYTALETLTGATDASEVPSSVSSESSSAAQ